MRKEYDVALLVLQFESFEEEVDLEDEPMYSTKFENVLGCVVHSSRQTWSMEEMVKESTTEGVSDYGRSKVKIPGDLGRWTLIGNVLLNRKERKFIERGAELLNPAGKVVAKAAQIVVPVDDPSKFEVIRERSQ